MKKITAFVLLCALCLAMIACSEARVETPEQPEETVNTELPVEPEVVEPEVVEPDVVEPEVVEPEVVEPEVVEPEVVEPETPIEAEEQVTDYIKIKVEKDGKITEHTFEFPEGFPKAGRTTPELVDIEDFDFGDYSLFVGMETKQISDGQDMVISYAILNENTKDIDDGILLYERLNKSLLTNGGGISDIWNEYLSNEIIPHVTYEDYLTKSRITYISEDADIFLRKSLTEVKDENGEFKKNLFYGWNTRYEIIDNKNNVLDTYDIEDTAINYTKHGSNDAYREFSSDYPHISYRFIYGNGRYRITTINEAYEETKLQRLSKKEMTIFNIGSDDSICNITLNLSQLFFIEDFDGSKLYFKVYNVNSEVWNIYYYDIEAEELKLLASNYIENILISPDGQYMASMPAHIDWWDISETGSGFYITELETGKTMYFDDSTVNKSEGFILKWVKTDNIMKLIEE